ncbi:MAG: AAA family ATPase [Cyanobacteria bacterium SBC]|nr:AAA family ATPase [Cyanobacteria bacterium SBC]
MIFLSGYQVVEELDRSDKTVVYRGYQQHDRRPAIVKTTRLDYPDLADIARIRHEYEIAASLDSPYLIRAYSLETYPNHRVAAVYEDIGGTSLDAVMRVRRFSIEESLDIALKLAEALRDLHQAKIVHKDLKPHNVIYNADTGRVQLIDFGIASRLSQEQPTLDPLNTLEGTLAYLSPEQTGRTNRPLDYRTDFYSFGVTLYEILTGQLPFNSNDALELVHYHIAKVPTPPELVVAEIPRPLSDLVMKLLAKTAEDRYQSAFGLIADLQECLRQWRERGSIEPFAIGRHDVSVQLQIPYKLYGREAELLELMQAFDRANSTPSGSIELVLVAGYSGVGKSALVREMHKPVARRSGYFAGGKFERLKRNVPYFAFVQALSELSEQLLAESSTRLARWKQQLVLALGANQNLAREIVPALKPILDVRAFGESRPLTRNNDGDSPSPQRRDRSIAPELGDTHNRFNDVFQQLLSVFANPEHPLVLFFDDLQWADSASLQLLQTLLDKRSLSSLLLIGAYRENEVTPTHPLSLALNEWHHRGISSTHTIALDNLNHSCVEQLVADTLHLSCIEVRPLATLLYRKTEGNPFFLTQLLLSLAREDLLVLDTETGRWTWDNDRLEQIDISENVIDLTVRKLRTLPLETQNLLMLASCIGNRFDLRVLSVVNERSQRRTAADLWAAVREGTIVPLGDAYKIPLALDPDDNLASTETSTASSIEAPSASVDAALDRTSIVFKFLHDRVQQAAYSLISPDIRQDVRVQIGKLLLKSTPPDRLEDRIFEIVNQFDAGADLMVRPDEKQQLAQLNLIAARKAKAAAAIQTALEYLNVGLNALGDEGWEREYELTVTLHLEAIELEAVNTHFDRALTLAQTVQQRANNRLHKAKAYQLRATVYGIQNQIDLALESGVQAIQMLGIPWDDPPLPTQNPRSLLPKRDEIARLPDLENTYSRLAVELLSALATTAAFTDVAVVRRAVLTQLKLSWQQGHCSHAAVAYAWYGALLCGAGDAESGREAALVARQLLDLHHSTAFSRERGKPLKGIISIVTASRIDPWFRPLNETLADLRNGWQQAWEAGDLTGSCHGAMADSSMTFWAEAALPLVVARQDTAIALLKKIDRNAATKCASLWREVSAALQEKVPHPLERVGVQNSAEPSPPDDPQPSPVSGGGAPSKAVLYATYLARTVVAVLFGAFDRALLAAERAEEYADIALGTVDRAYQVAYGLLARLGTNQSLDGPAKTARAHLFRWARRAPENFQHLLDLVDAETYRIAGDFLNAMEAYDCAVATAHQYGHAREAALANERAACFYFEWGREPIAALYLYEAYRTYRAYGAISKVRDLTDRYPQLLQGTAFRDRVAGPPQGYAPTSNAIDLERTQDLRDYDFSRPSSGQSQNYAPTETAIAQPADRLDRATAIKATHALSSEIVLESLLKRLMSIVLENAGAQTGFLILASHDGMAAAEDATLVRDTEIPRLFVEAAGTVTTQQIAVRQSIPLEACELLPKSIVYYVARRHESLVLNDAATTSTPFTYDPYIQQYRPRSLLCLPIERQQKLIGLLYLENNLTPGAFTHNRLELLGLLCAQAAISIENATLYQQLRDSERRERERSRQLEQSLHDMESLHLQLIQSEKMSALGQLVAGIAHEINNPVGFILGNLTLAENYIEDLIEHLQLYRERFPEPGEEFCLHAEEIDLDYLFEDAPKLLSSMKVGVDRIRDISKALRTFSRTDTDVPVSTDLHDNIDSTLLILKHRLKANDIRPEIEVVKRYGELPSIECYAGQLNQVFTNLIANAIDAIEEAGRDRSYRDWSDRPPRITISTDSSTEGEAVIVRITDNGTGMPESVRTRMFDRQFTTKPVGKGTGLGLSISHAIVVEKHGGSIECTTEAGVGTEFTIVLPLLQ